jgi:hypothetical protein
MAESMADVLMSHGDEQVAFANRDDMGFFACLPPWTWRQDRQMAPAALGFVP